MLYRLYREPSRFMAVSIDPEYFSLDKVDTVSDGVVCRKSVVKSISVAKTFKGFSIRDFDISTIIVTGSDKLLKPSVFRNADVASMANAMTSVIKMFDQNEKSA